MSLVVDTLEKVNEFLYITNGVTPTFTEGVKQGAICINRSGAGLWTYGAGGWNPIMDEVGKLHGDASVLTNFVDIVRLKGSIDASGNPNYPTASSGDSYLVSVAGKVGGASGKVVDAGDFVVALNDVASGAEAAAGGSWTVLEHNLPDTPALKVTVPGYVNHGSTAGTTRPSGFAAVLWYGTVEPDNMIAGDIWFDSTP